MKKVSNYHRSVEPYTEDATGYLALSFIGNEMLRCAGLHASERGFGYEQMIKKNLVWVLSRLTMQFTTRPKSFEQYTIRTWVHRIYRQFTDRLFEILNAKGEPIGYAYSVWAAIDYTTRKPIDLEHEAMHAVDDIILPTPNFPIKKMSRVRLSQKESCGEHIAGFSDLDINGHVNSMRYLDMIQDLFTWDEYKHHVPCRIDLQYCKESYCGDKLYLFKEEKQTEVFDIEIRKENEVIVRCEFEFNKS